jgi:hypothetical protein
LNPITGENITSNEQFVVNVNRDLNCDEINTPISDQEIMQSIDQLRAHRSPRPAGDCLGKYKNSIRHIILPFLKAYEK